MYFYFQNISTTFENELYSFSVSAVTFIAIFSRLTSNVYVLIILLLGEIMFGLDNLGEWEDLVLYKQENKAVVERSVWCDRLCFARSSDSSTMRLTDIRHVGLSAGMDLFLLHRDGRIVTLSMKGLTREEIQGLRKEINYFLNMSRLKYLDHATIDPADRLLLASDSEEYLRKLPRTCPPASNELTVSDNVLGGGKPCHRIQQNLSFPRLVRAAQLDDYQSTKRGPYTENSMCLGRVTCTNNICALAPRNLLKHHEEHNRPSLVRL